jgi:hypothetical protein
MCFFQFPGIRKIGFSENYDFYDLLDVLVASPRIDHALFIASPIRQSRINLKLMIYYPFRYIKLTGILTGMLSLFFLL